MGRKKNLPILERIEVTDIGARGKAIARVDGFVTFVSGALPGDVVDAQVVRKRRTYQEARMVRTHSLSDKRTEPFCRHFGECGGCRWQDLQYAGQLKYKQQEVGDALHRIGKLELPAISPILASEMKRHYRNKLEFTFSNRRWLTEAEVSSGKDFGERKGLGFHKPGLFDKVLDLDECFLQPEPSNAIRLAVREIAEKEGLSYYDLRNGGGLLRTLIIRNTLKGEWMVIVVFFEDDPGARKRLLNALRKRFPSLDSLMFCINRKANDTIGDQEILLHSGRDHIIEEMESLRFRIGPKSFFQTNSLQALELYRKVREFAQLNGKETVYDLYCGTGTIALFLAAASNRVVGVESVEAAVEDARRNAELNIIGNASFFAGDLKDMLNEAFIRREGRPDVLITDPPRAGMHEKVVEGIRHASPGRIVYVSCNPATQARDLQLLDPDYRVVRVQPVDMFPQTYHVENIALLEKR